MQFVEDLEENREKDSNGLLRSKFVALIVIVYSYLEFSRRSSVRVIDPTGRMCFKGRKRNVCECERAENREFISS